MTVTPDEIYASPGVVFAMGRQPWQGQARTKNLVKILNTQIEPNLLKELASLGQEVGGNTISRQRDLPQSFKPTLPLNGHMRVGGHMLFMCKSGYMPLAVGVPLDSPIDTTLGAAVANRHQMFIQPAALTGITVGMLLQIGGLAGADPAITDMSEVHEVTAIGPATQVQTIKIYGSGLGGTYTISPLGTGETSAAIAPTANAAAMESALTGIPSIGTGGCTVTGSAGAGYVVTYAGGNVSKPMPPLVVDYSSLTGTKAGVKILLTTQGLTAAQVALKAGMLYLQPSGAVVQAVKSNWWIRHYFKHVQPDNALAGDYYTGYLKWANSKNTHHLFMWDGKSNQFNYSSEAGQIPTYNAQTNYLDASRETCLVSNVSTISDPSSYAIQNTRGSMSIMGNSVDLPRSLNISMATQIFEDMVITEFLMQSGVHIAHDLTVSYSGKFVADHYDKAVYGGANEERISDSLFESAFEYRAASPVKIGASSVNYGFGLVATDAQYGNYRPSANTNQPITGALESMTVVPSIEDNSERWYWYFDNKCSSDIYAAVY